ncbi:metal-dependent hydrolase [Alcanivorax sp. DP30]|uniref:metal-dependent hydrolase n=1 Tax=Alcanivorax sp. DP30 TaxID=2606217 RepID=UPI001368A4F4|nr:metal-dependent hydrolase [Alcanivorax sp. DP30]MZR63657.1 metal-dependent hydrolase [Alcanivorax sp. DP30]
MKLSLKKQKKAPVVPITPRRMGFDFSGIRNTDYWFDNDPVLTHLLNMLSLTFPDGERFFVDSVRAMRDQVEDPARQKDISGFIGQEAMHSLEHQAFNDLIAEGKYDDIVKHALAVTNKLLDGARQYMSKRQQLAATAGLEHFTAILADAILRRPELINKMDPAVRDLWVWHAIEETEHKAVAYDLYKDVGGTYLERQRLFLSSTAYLIGFSSYFTWQMLKRDNIHKKPLTLAKGLWKGFGYKGVISSIIPDWFTYLKPGFHPWDDDNSALIEEWRKTLPKPKGKNAA